MDPGITCIGGYSWEARIGIYNTFFITFAEARMQYFIAFIYFMLVCASMMHGAMVPLPSEPTLTLIFKKDLFLLCV